VYICIPAEKQFLLMKVCKVYTKPNTVLSKRIEEWVFENKIEYVEIPFDDDFDEQIQGLVVLNQNQDVERDILEIRKSFDEKQKPVQRIDINGTLMVGVSNFSLWLERNGCESILIVGSDSLCENPNLERYFSHMKLG
jgi:hypothetical protein